MTASQLLRPLAAASAIAIAVAAHAKAPNHFDAAVSVDPIAGIRLEVAGSYRTGLFDESAAEIAAYDPGARLLFVTNASANTVDVLSIINVRKPRLKYSIDLASYGAGVNSVAVQDGLVAVAVEAEPKQDPGSVVLFDRYGRFLDEYTVGALPDMLTFTPDGRYILVANEGEPNDDYTIDPEGSISRIDLLNDQVLNIGFESFNGLDLAPVRIYGPGATVAQDIEPEYIAVSEDGATAWVSLQENNAIAIVDVVAAMVTDIVPLGTKDHAAVQNALDASNRDDAINIRTWPAVGMYQPDAIAAFEIDGETYIVTANEGDARDYDGFSEEARIGDVGDDFQVDPDAYPDLDLLTDDARLGRLNITTATGDLDGDGDIELLHAYGARSFSVLNAAGEIVYDSGSEFERIIASYLPAEFNSNNDENDSFDARSDDKGPEPEGVTTGVVDGRTYAFIGLERIGGIMVYDVSAPLAPRFVSYVNNRNFEGDAEADTAGDLGPEGLVFIPAHLSPRGKPLLVVTNEVSGSTTIYTVERGVRPGRPRWH